METPRCPYEGFYQFRSKTNEFQTLVDFFSSHRDETGFGSAKSLLSLGAGDGTLDLALISKSLPALCSYTGLECDAKNYGHLKNKLTEYSEQLSAEVHRDGLTLTPVLSYAEQYAGPGEPVDVVLMMHILYYLRERKGEMIRRALGWLKPGGRLVIGVVGHDDVLQKLANIGASDLVTWPTRTVSELRALGLSYKEFCVEHKFNHTGCDKKFADFVLEKTTSETEAAAVLDGLQTLAEPGTDTILHATHVFVVQKT